jgi:hypothetical protein
MIDIISKPQLTRICLTNIIQNYELQLKKMKS